MVTIFIPNLRWMMPPIVVAGIAALAWRFYLQHACENGNAPPWQLCGLAQQPGWPDGMRIYRRHRYAVRQHPDRLLPRPRFCLWPRALAGRVAWLSGARRQHRPAAAVPPDQGRGVPQYAPLHGSKSRHRRHRRQCGVPSGKFAGQIPDPSADGLSRTTLLFAISIPFRRRRGYIAVVRHILPGATRHFICFSWCHYFCPWRPTISSSGRWSGSGGDSGPMPASLR